MDIKIKNNSKLKIQTFTRLEYIKSNGTQYIDTGVLQSTIKKYELVWMGDATSVPTLGGKSGGWGYNDSLISYLYAGNKIYYSSGNGNGVGMDGVTGVKYTEIYNDGTLSVNRQTRNIGTLQKNVNLTIFYGGRRYGNGKIYSMKIYDQSMNLIRDFLPAKDYFGVVCLYDNVSQTFFYNQGTGNFVAGPITQNGLPETVLLKTLSIFHQNTPNVNALSLIKSVVAYQKTHQDEVVLLNRIRADIGNVEGSLFDLMELAGMAGFNDNYEPQAKPRLVGTYTINDWYTQEQLTAVQAAFDGLTIVPDPNYLIDFSQLAVQTLDDTQPNYNPAVAIILQGNNKGTTLVGSVVTGGGRWFLTKTQAAAITGISDWFQRKTTVTDTNGIVGSDTTATYDFESGKEFIYFSSLSGSNNMFANDSKLKKLGIPNSLNFNNIGDWCGGAPITEIYLTDLYPYIIRDNSRSINSHPFGRTNDNHIYINDVELTEVIIPNNCTYVGNCAFKGCKNITSVIIHDDVKQIKAYAFAGCINITSINLNSITYLQENSFSNVKTVSFKNNVTLTHIYNQALISVDYSDLLVSNLVYLQGQPFKYASNMMFPNIVSINATGNICKDRFITLGSNVTSIRGWQFFCQGTQGKLHILAETPPSIVVEGSSSVLKIYVGDGSSAAHDDAILADYVAASGWSSFSSKLDTWYNYLHPQS